jgi:hypothetical protein
VLEYGDVSHREAYVVAPPVEIEISGAIDLVCFVQMKQELFRGGRNTTFTLAGKDANLLLEFNPQGIKIIK